MCLFNLRQPQAQPPCIDYKPCPPGTVGDYNSTGGPFSVLSSFTDASMGPSEEERVSGSKITPPLKLTQCSVPETDSLLWLLSAVHLGKKTEAVQFADNKCQ